MNTVTPLRAKTSASKMLQAKLCPGSVLAQADLPEEESEFAAEGTLLHWHDANPDQSRDGLSEAQRDALTRNKALRDRFIAETKSTLQIPEDATEQVIVEREFFLCDNDGIPLSIHDELHPGHPDVIYWYPEYQVAIIFDSKFGRIEVTSAEANLQLRDYVVMFAEQYEAQKVYAAISQPWVSADNSFHAACYEAGDIPGFKAEIIGILQATENPNAPRHASVDACRYCKAKAYCQEALGVIEGLAEFEVNKVSIAELEALGPFIELARNVDKAWEKRIRMIFEQKPELLKTYEVGKDGETRSITDSAKAFQAMVKAGDLLDSDPTAAAMEFSSCCDASRSQLETLIAKNRGITNDEACSRLTIALGPIIKASPRKGSVQRKKVAKR
jgi:hypothetical protein